MRDPRRQVTRTRRRHEGRTISGDLSRPADVRRHHSGTERERLLEPERLSLPHGGAHDQICGGEEVRHVVAMTEQDDGELLRGDPRREMPEQGAVAGNGPHEAMPSRQVTGVDPVPEQPRDVAQEVEPLLRSQARDRDEQRGGRVQPEVGPHHGGRSSDRRSCRRRHERPFSAACAMLACALDEVAGRLADGGATVHLAPFDAPWGQRYATVLDPDGNHVDLFAPLA